MADPLEEVKAAAPKTRSRVWAEKGTTKDVNVAKKRVAASRATRKKRTPKATLSGSYKGSYVSVVERISDRFDVSRVQVLERFIIDGIQKYGTQEEIAAAELPKPNPFDKFVAAPAPRVAPVIVTENLIEDRTFTYPRESRPAVSGPPLPTSQDAYKGLFDEGKELPYDPTEPTD